MACHNCIFACVLACVFYTGEGVRQTVDTKQKVEGNGNKCLRKVVGWDNTFFGCFHTKPCGREISNHQSEGYVGCVYLGCDCRKGYNCMKRPHYSGESFCLAASAAATMTAACAEGVTGCKLFTTSDGEYMESSECEFESFGFSTKHFTDTKGCIGNVVDSIAAEDETLPSDSFMDITEHIAFADEAQSHSQGNGNKCMGIVNAWNTVRFTCKTGSMAWMRQCGNKIQSYTSKGYISCQDLGCSCPKDYFCFRQPLFTKQFCLASAEVDTLTTRATTPSAKSIYESEKLSGLELLQSTTCSFEGFGANVYKHITDTKGCEKGPDDAEVVEDLAELVKDGVLNS